MTMVYLGETLSKSFEVSSGESFESSYQRENLLPICSSAVELLAVSSMIAVVTTTGRS